jgi:hypothetical protein
VPEYINRSELAKGKYHPLPYTHITPPDVDVESYKRGWNDAIDAAIDAIPAADVVERKPGVWTEIHTVCDKGYGQIRYMHKACSTELYQSPYNFCPRCGCKMGRMDGGQDDGTA